MLRSLLREALTPQHFNSGWSLGVIIITHQLTDMKLPVGDCGGVVAIFKIHLINYCNLAA